MLTINRMTEYATLVMARFAADPAKPKSATDLAAEIPLAITTLRKLLQILAHHGLLISQKGRKGGFTLARPASEITMAQVLDAMEEPIALTHCSHANGACHLKDVCKPRTHWLRINKGIHSLLDSTTLIQMISDPKEPAP